MVTQLPGITAHAARAWQKYTNFVGLTSKELIWAGFMGNCQPIYPTTMGWPLIRPTRQLKNPSHVYTLTFFFLLWHSFIVLDKTIFNHTFDLLYNCVFPTSCVFKHNSSSFSVNNTVHYGGDQHNQSYYLLLTIHTYLFFILQV